MEAMREFAMATEAPGVSSLLDLSGRTVIITGASGNIGTGIARRVSGAGANTVLGYHSDPASAQSLAAEINDRGGSAVAIGADLAEADAANNLFSATLEHFGSVYGLVNNAGIQPIEAFDDITPTSFRTMLRTNTDGPFALIQALARNVGADSGAAVVNIASIEGSQPAVLHTHYAISKAALIMATRAAALELGRRNIRVNCVSPGLIHREGIEDAWPQGVNRWRAAAPLERLGQPEDVGDAVLFLLSDAARWITGIDLVVDGGVLTCTTW